MDERIDAELMTRAAWLYYVAGLNQETTSHRLGITRARVNRLLQQAREDGIVTISVNERDLGLLPVEEILRAQFGLKTCIATPPLAAPSNRSGSGRQISDDAALRLVGATAAGLLRDRLAAYPQTIVGTGWGRTLAAMAQSLAGLKAPQARFVSVMGSLTAKSAFNPFDVVQTLAHATGGEGYFLPVPFIVDTPADRDLLLSQQAVQEPFALARKADVVMISVGELTQESLLCQQGMVSAADLTELRAAGAVGDTNGIFFDRNGRPVDHPLNQRCVALNLDQLRTKETVLLSVGLAKLSATRALLNSGAIQSLVIDGDSALALAEDVSAEP